MCSDSFHFFHFLTFLEGYLPQGPYGNPGYPPVYPSPHVHSPHGNFPHPSHVHPHQHAHGIPPMVGALPQAGPQLVYPPNHGRGMEMPVCSFVAFFNFFFH